MNNFEGDVYIFDTPNSGDIALEDGLFLSDKSIKSAVYLSLFGGNEKDAGRVKNKETWWGNVISNTKENEKLVSQFQSIIKGMPLNTQTIKLAINAVNIDLEWLIKDGVVDKIEINYKIKDINKLFLIINLIKNGLFISENYYLDWK